MNILKKTTGLALAVMITVCGCQNTDISGEPAEVSGGEADMKDYKDIYADFSGEPYIVRTMLREYTAVNPDSRIGVYGRYTELTVEGQAPETFRNAVTASNQRAEESVRIRADQILAEKKPDSSKTEGYQFVTCGYIANVTRADHTAFSFLETEFEKETPWNMTGITYRFRGLTYDTESGKEILLSDLAGDEAAVSGMLQKSLSSKYGIEGLAAAGSGDYAWTSDVLGIRFYFNSDAVSEKKRREKGDYSDRAVTVSYSYDALPGEKAKTLSDVPESYIAMIDRGAVYDLPHGDMSVKLDEKDGSHTIRIMKGNKEEEELEIEYGDDLSDYYIIRAEGGFYLFRGRIGYQEGFFYDFSRPDGGFGRFAYNPSQYFDSFLREIQLAVPYNPYCVHMAEVRRSFGEKSYDKSSFIPHGHYSFPSDPSSRYKRFFLRDRNLQIDSYNTACRLLEDLAVTETDTEGNALGKITVPAGKSLIFEGVIGEAARYDDPPKRNNTRTFLYECRLADGRHISFESPYDSTIYTEKGYMNRFTEPVSLWEAQSENESPVEPEKAFTVRIGEKDYPLIPDYSLHGHSGEEIDFGDDIWWLVEGYPGTYVSTDEDMKDMQDSYYTQEALSHPDERAELVIGENGEAVFDCFGEIYRGSLPEKRFYKTDVEIFMESKTQRRTFRIILREGKDHSKPSRIEFYSEGLPATNEPSKVPPLTVYLTRTRGE